MGNKRIYGLDLLRIVSMMGIVGLHVLGQGGILKGCTPPPLSNYVNYCLAWLMEIIFYSSVDIFAMLTGFLYINKRTKSSSIINLIFITLLYSWIILICMIFCKPEIFAEDKHMYLKGFFTFFTNHYWYITCYILLFFMIPFINKLLCSISKQEFKKLILIGFIFLSVITTFGLSDYFRIKGGYSPYWLMYCYIIGAYINMYGFEKQYKTTKLIIIYIISNIIMLFSKLAIPYVTNMILGHSAFDYLLVQYNSPFVLLNAVILICIFKNIEIKNTSVQKIILSLSSAAFGVYILHGNILIYNYILKNSFKPLALQSPVILILSVISVISAIYFVCWLIELIRQFIFSKCHINNLAKKLGSVIDKFLNI